MSWTHSKREAEKAWRKANPDKVRAMKRRAYANKKAKEKQKRELVQKPK